MATLTLRTTGTSREADDELSIFCAELFSSLPRSDQREWGEVYIRGLLSVPGRKSIRRISEQVAGRRADQNLQQFVNQSPWQWNDVRRTLARRASPRPRAWLVHEAVFPKHGSNSVGVERQYVPSIGRTLNCQLGLAVSLANEYERCMVNWRLVLPSSWDDDRERRGRARVPDDVRHFPQWRHVFDAVEEMTLGWRLRPAPIVWNAHDQETRPLLSALTARRLPYLVQVTPSAPVTLSNTEPESVTTARELAAVSADRRHLMFRGRDRATAHGPMQYSQLSICDLCPPGQRVHVTLSCRHGGTRRVLAQWSRRVDGGDLTGVWLTNLTKAGLPQLVDLVELRPRAHQEDMTALREDFGLQDFEGRSFMGWHHHVTLVSAAHGYRMLRRKRQPPAARSHARYVPNQ